MGDSTLDIKDATDGNVSTTSHCTGFQQMTAFGNNRHVAIGNIR